MAAKNARSPLENFIPFNKPVDADTLKEAARRELGETEELREESLKQLKELINDNDIASITTDEFLLRFLRSMKYDVQGSFEVLRNYAKCRVTYHDRLLKLQPETVMKVLVHHKFLGIFPYRDAEGRLIYSATTGIWHPDMCSDGEVFMVLNLIMNYVAEKPSSQIVGIIGVANAKVLPFYQIAYTMRQALALKHFMFECVPVRYIKFHVINECFLFKNLLRLLDTILPKEIKEKILLHGRTREDLYQDIAIDILPDEFGGTLGPLSNDHNTRMAAKNARSTLESFIPFNVPVDADRLKDVIRRELGETEELREESLKQLQELINRNNITSITTDDFLLRFLRAMKYNVQRSFEVLRNYAKHRVNYHDRLLKLQPKTVVKALVHHKFFGIFPYRDGEGRLICTGTSGIWRPDICSDEEVVMLLILLMNYAAETPSSQIVGIIAAGNAKIMPLYYIPYIMRNVLAVKHFLLECIPVKYIKIHIINESYLFKYLLRLLDPFIPKEIKEMILFHGRTREDLCQDIAPEILPDEFGGSLGPLSNDHLIDEILDYLKKMKDEQRYFIKQSVS